MTIQSITAVIHHPNFHYVLNRQKGQWLEVDTAGRLHTINGLIQKIWFVIRNFLAGGQIFTRTMLTIQNIWKRVFQEFCIHNLEPLARDSLVFTHFKAAIHTIAQKLRSSPQQFCDAKIASYMQELAHSPEILEAKLAIEKGLKPSPIHDGVSGSYIIYNRVNQPWAIFKPRDQEIGVSHNPKGYGGECSFLTQAKITPGTSYQRERAAYLLDHKHFSRVPFTDIAELPRALFTDVNASNSVVKGSFQRYVPDCKCLWDHYRITPLLFTTNRTVSIPATEIHRLALLDIRLLNCDRHLNNALVSKELHIRPIDHGFAFPGSASNLRFDWMNFKEANEAFSEEELSYIEELNPEADAELLRKEAPEITEEAIHRIKRAGLLLKIAAKKGLTAYQIGDLMCGPRPSLINIVMNVFAAHKKQKPSPFEEVFGSYSGNDFEGYVSTKINDYLKASRNVLAFFSRRI